MKKIFVFAFVVFFVFSGLSADGFFNGLNVQVEVGGETFSGPVRINNFNAFRYDMAYSYTDDEYSYLDIYTLSFNCINAVEKQNRVFAMVKISGGGICEVYGKIGMVQFTEVIHGGLKVRWHDELSYRDVKGYQYLEYMGNSITSQPYNAPFWGIGAKIYLIKAKKITFSVNADYSTFRVKKFGMDLLYNNEEFLWETDRYIDKIVVDFDGARNETLKLGAQIDIHGENISPWMNIGYVLYETELEGKYTTRFISNAESFDQQKFSTKSQLVNNILLSTGIKFKVAKNFELEATASLGAFNGAGLYWKIFL